MLWNCSKPWNQQIIEITDEDVQDLKQQLQEKGKAQRTFEYYFFDTEDKKIAKVSNTIYLRMRNDAKIT